MSLKRTLHPIPNFIISALKNENLMERYLCRPPYQQNDYIGWITRAKRPETVEKRLGQMLDELKNGSLYMGMAYRAK